MNWLRRLFKRGRREVAVGASPEAESVPVVVGITPGGDVEIDHDDDQDVVDAYRDDRGVVMIWRRNDGTLYAHRLHTAPKFIVKIECLSSAYRAPDYRLN